MTEPKRIACSLSASDLRQRLCEMAALGAESLIARETEDGVHTLRFRSDERTHLRLQQIVAAESRCCPFLGLGLAERDGELVLTVVAPAEGRSVANELVASFEGSGTPTP